MITNRVIRSLPFIVIAFTASLAVAQSVNGNDSEPDGGGCIDEGRRWRGMGDRAAPVYPFTVGSRSIE